MEIFEIITIVNSVVNTACSVLIVLGFRELYRLNNMYNENQIYRTTVIQNKI